MAKDTPLGDTQEQKDRIDRADARDRAAAVDRVHAARDRDAAAVDRLALMQERED